MFCVQPVSIFSYCRFCVNQIHCELTNELKNQDFNPDISSLICVLLIMHNGLQCVMFFFVRAVVGDLKWRHVMTFCFYVVLNYNAFYS
jgi:hypothetical protein